MSARRLLSVASGVTLVVVLIVALAATAGAHAELESSEPAAGSVLAEPPQEIALHFSEPVELQLGSVRVLDGQRRQVDTGAPEREDGDRTVRVALPRLADGVYVVSWRVVSADSHPVAAAFVFTVGSAAVPSDAATIAASVRTASDRPVGVLFGAVRAVAFAALAVLIGGGLFLAGLWPAAGRNRAVRRLLVGAWGAALITSLAGIGLQGAYAAGGTLRDTLRPSLWAEVSRTHFGEAWLARAVVLCVVALPLLIVILRRSAFISPPLALGWGVALAGLVITVVVAGHAATGRWVWVGIAADAVHVTAMSFWLGGLAVLLVVLASTDPRLLVDLVPRFSQLAFGAVVLIVGSGVVQAWRQVGTLDGLTSSSYGRLLLVKVGLVAVMVAFAARSRGLLAARSHASDAVRAPDAAPVSVGARAGAPDGTDRTDDAAGSTGRPGGSPTGAGGEVGAGTAGGSSDAGVRRSLRRSVLGEVLTAVVVVAVTAALVNAPPPRRPASGPWDVQLTLGTLQADVVVDPPRQGTSEMHVYLSTALGAPAEVDEVTAGLTQPDGGAAPLDVAFTRITGNHFVSNALVFPYPGRWTVLVQARTGDFDLQSGTFTVPIR